MFTKDTISFLRALKRNNNRDWFHENHDRYKEVLIEPSKQFLEELAVPMRKMFPTVQVDKKSMFRIARDTRFSADKAPYKTWIGFLLRDRGLDDSIAPAFYLGVDQTGFAFGCGIYSFEKPMRERFRARVTDPVHGKTFRAALKAAEKAGYKAMGKDLKKIPAGYDADHENAEFLLHNGFFMSKEQDLLKVFESPKFPEYVVKQFAPLKPMFTWLRDMPRTKETLKPPVRKMDDLPRAPNRVMDF